MAQFYSDTYAIQRAPTPKNRNSAVIENGRYRCYEALVTLESGVAAGDTVVLCEVPAGYRLRVHDCDVVSEDITDTAGAATIHVGDDDDTTAADEDRYAVSLNVAAAGTDNFASTAAVARLTPYTTQKTCRIIMKFATLVSPTVGKKLRFYLVFAAA